MKVLNSTRKISLANRAIEARSFFMRLKGLLGRGSFTPGEALIIPNCRCIHMVGMRFPIDAIFVDRDNRIVHLASNLKPGSLSPYVLRAHKVIELPAGTIVQSESAVGDILQFQEA